MSYPVELEAFKFSVTTSLHVPKKNPKQSLWTLSDEDAQVWISVSPLETEEKKEAFRFLFK